MDTRRANFQHACGQSPLSAMRQGLRPEQVFWSRLIGPQQVWLSGQLKAQPAPPSAGGVWSCDGIDIGWVSADRAQDMVALLPGCTLSQGRLQWQSGADHALQRSQALQGFLVQQAAQGRLTGWRGEFFAWWPDTPAWPHALDVPPFV